MFGYKTFLRIGLLNDSSITGLYKDSYELQSCSYAFSQGVDEDGKPQTEVRGGLIYITYPMIPPADILQWMLKSNKFEDGAIVICDENDTPLEKIMFEQAACIGLEIDYMQKGQSYLSTRITLQVKKLSVGSVHLENRWNF